MGVPDSEERMYELHAALCQTLANPRRLRLLNLLRGRELSVNELAKAMGLPQANVSQHLSVLRERGVVETRREGVTIYYEVANPKMIKACDLVREVLMDRLAKTRELVKHVAKSA